MIGLNDEEKIKWKNIQRKRRFFCSKCLHWLYAYKSVKSDEILKKKKKTNDLISLLFQFSR